MQLGRRLVLLCCAALGACAPAATFRPATPMLDFQNNEFGWGLTAGNLVNPKAAPGTAPNASPITSRTNRIATGDFWYYHQFSSWLDVGARVFAGASATIDLSSPPAASRPVGQFVDGAFGLGPTVRFRLLNLKRLRLAIDTGAGWAYAQVGVAAALRLHDRIWIYTSPQMTYFGNFEVGFPVGVSFRITPYFSLLAEITPHLLLPDALLLTGGVGMTFRL